MNYKLKLIEQIQTGKPRVHATGFAQLYIAPDTRLHVWTDALILTAPDISQIVFKHDHRYGIESFVLRGLLHDEIVSSWFDPVMGQWERWTVRPAHEGDAEKPHRDDTCGYSVKLIQERVIRAGQSYTIPKRAFHSTRAVGTTVTIMRKYHEEDAWARLLVPKGFDPIHSLVSQPDVDFIRGEMIKAVWGVRDADVEEAVASLSCSVSQCGGNGHGAGAEREATVV